MCPRRGSVEAQDKDRHKSERDRRSIRCMVRDMYSTTARRCTRHLHRYCTALHATPAPLLHGDAQYSHAVTLNSASTLVLSFCPSSSSHVHADVIKLIVLSSCSVGTRSSAGGTLPKILNTNPKPISLSLSRYPSPLPSSPSSPLPRYLACSHGRYSIVGAAETVKLVQAAYHGEFLICNHPFQPGYLLVVHDAGRTAAFVLHPSDNSMDTVVEDGSATATATPGASSALPLQVKFQHKLHNGLVKLVQYARSVPFVCNHATHPVKLASAAPGGTILDPTELTAEHSRARLKKCPFAMVRWWCAHMCACVRVRV